jgi:hypothetical protein
MTYDVLRIAQAQVVLPYPPGTLLRWRDRMHTGGPFLAVEGGVVPEKAPLGRLWPYTPARMRASFEEVA